MSYLSTIDFFEDKDFVDRYQYTLRTGELDELAIARYIDEATVRRWRDT